MSHPPSLLCPQPLTRCQAQGRHAFKEHHKLPGVAQGSENIRLSGIRTTSGSQRSGSLIRKTNIRQTIAAVLGGKVHGPVKRHSQSSLTKVKGKRCPFPLKERGLTKELFRLVRGVGRGNSEGGMNGFASGRMKG